MSIIERFYTIMGEPKEGEIENYSYGLDNLTSEQQKQVEELLKEYLSFGKVEWMELPAQVIINSKGEEVAIVAKTRKIDDEPTEDKNDRTLYLYKVLYSPVIYDPIDLHKPVKDSMVMSPLLHNPHTYEPYRTLAISWKPEDLFHEKEIQPITWEDEKTYLREKLETLLTNPDKYKSKGRRSLMIRFALDKTEEK
jgi:hypothetical protein